MKTSKKQKQFRHSLDLNDGVARPETLDAHPVIHMELYLHLTYSVRGLR